MSPRRSPTGSCTRRVNEVAAVLRDFAGLKAGDRVTSRLETEHVRPYHRRRPARCARRARRTVPGRRGAGSPAYGPPWPDTFISWSGRWLPGTPRRSQCGLKGSGPRRGIRVSSPVPRCWARRDARQHARVDHSDRGALHALTADAKSHGHPGLRASASYLQAAAARLVFDGASWAGAAAARGPVVRRAGPGRGRLPGETDRSVIWCLTQLAFLGAAVHPGPGAGKREAPAFLVLVMRRPAPRSGAGTARGCEAGDKAGWPQSCGGC